MKKLMKKVCSITLMACLCISLAPTTTGAKTLLNPPSFLNTETPKELESSVEKVLNAVKNSDEKTLSKYCRNYYEFFTDPEDTEEARKEAISDIENELIDAAVSAEDFLKTNISKMTYSVKSYSVSGNKAKVKVTFKYKNADAIFEKMEDYFVEALITGMIEDDYFESEEALYDMMIFFYKSLIETDLTWKTQTITLQFEKRSTVWKMEDFSVDLTNIMLLNLSNAYQDYLDDLREEYYFQE